MNLGRGMPYNENQLKRFRKEREEFLQILQKRKQLEEIWKSRKDAVYVPTTKLTTLSGQQLLDYAVKLGEIEHVKRLVEGGASSKSAILYAYQGGYDEIAQYLISNFKLKEGKKFPLDLLEIVDACDSQRKESLQAFIKMLFKNILNDSTILISDEDDGPDKESVSLATYHSPNLFHLGALMPFSEFMGLWKENNLYDSVSQYDLKVGLNWGDDSAAGKKGGHTPLAYAIKAGNKDFINYLLQHGASLNEIVNHTSQKTALEYAIEVGNLEIVQFLLQNGANLKGNNNRQESLLHLAVISGNYETIAFVLTLPQSEHPFTNYQKTPLHYLARCEDEKIIQMVLNHPSMQELIQKEDFFGNTPMQLAQRYNNKFYVELLKQKGVIQNPPKEEKPPIYQYNVYFILRHYLKLTNSGNPKSFTLQGYCNAFAFLYLYYRKRGLQNEFFKILHLIASWKGDFETLQNQDAVKGLSGDYKNVGELFYQWINDLNWFQQSRLDKELKESINPSQRARMAQYDVVKKDSQEFALSPVLLTSQPTEFGQQRVNMNLTSSQLAEYLTILQQFRGIGIELTGGVSWGAHATAIYVSESGDLEAYDPNYPEIPPSITSPIDLAEHIKNTKYRQLGMLLPGDQMTIGIQFYPEHPYIAFPNRLNAWNRADYINYHASSANKLTPLHVAIIANDRIEIEKILTNKDIPLDLKDASGNTALEFAKYIEASEITQIFYKHHPELNPTPRNASALIFDAIKKPISPVIPESDHPADTNLEGEKVSSERISRNNQSTSKKPSHQ